ncbi:MAG: glycoside hydrolase family 2 protein [Dysgonamonadaceae bacterium]|nr:glycoside hydrolase family 2 protein [Dysgonamonadaceae bacterium]
MEAKVEKMVLHSGWNFRQARLSKLYPAIVPGVVHLDLMANRIIEDPFYRLNERGVQWIDKEDWVYETMFDLPEELFGRENIRIVFEGLDTYADVYLNDRKMLEANNMFRRWEINIKNEVKRDGNILRIYFHSPVKVDLPKWQAMPYLYEASNDQSENGGLLDMKLSVFARKAGYHYGWDWGPRLVTSGIWRPVFIEGWDDVRIQDVQIIQHSVTAKKAKISAVVELAANDTISQSVIRIINHHTQKELANIHIPLLQKGLNRVVLDFDISNPQLWWSNGLGEPHLYMIKTVLESGNGEVDSHTQKIGIRSIRLVREKEGDGQTFYFELNGIPVFVKGANYIPCDAFLPRVSRETYRQTILDAVKAHMNMLRVWGGGIYEDDYFYDLCDEYGIMVWQDFMFACSMYPAEGSLLENIRMEAIDNVCRLRNHPSIAVWCGNNECQDAWLGWGWKEKVEKRNKAFADKIWQQYETQYYKVLPEVVAEYGSGAPYTPSSPFGGYGKTSTGKEGDSHYWAVWHQKKPINEYNNERSRFFSEYGFQSFPELESVKLYAPEKDDWNISSEVMTAHQRGGDFANKLIETYLLSEYYPPKDFPSFLYLSQVLQGDAIRTAIESHRRDKGYCMGSLFWQHNDCWPVASWSSRDYYGRWKAQHYFARQAYRELLLSPIEKEGVFHVYAISDRLKSTSGVFSVTLMDLNGKRLYTHKEKISVKANVAQIVFSKDTDEMLKGYARNKVVANVRLVVDGEMYSNNYLFERHKNICFPPVSLHHTVLEKEENYEISLTADKYARGVFLSVDGIENFFSDNYFDILPGETKTITLQTPLSLQEVNSQLKIISIINTY